MKTNPSISKIKRWSLVGVAMAVVAGVYSPMVSAHGEKSQPAFMRMRTIHWYDLNWSTDKLKVNDEMTVTGKFYVFKDWPESVRKPEDAFLNIGIPGPTFIRTQSYVGGQLAHRSLSLELGKHYDFKVVLKARRPGRWHVHTMMNVMAGGPVIGPGKWVEIEGSMADFKNPITTLTGQTVDLERFNLGTIYGWSFLWYLIGIAWIWWWARRPTFLPRFYRVAAGQEQGLVTEQDKRVAIGFAVGTVVLVVLGYINGNSNYPITVPLQAGNLGYPPTAAVEEKVNVAVERAEYKVPGRSVTMKISVTNNSDAPVELAEFETAGIRFLNSAVLEDDTGYPENLLAEEGLEVDDKNPIQPGETRTLNVSATDAAWETERMADLVYDPDSRFGGLLFFLDSNGKKNVVPIGGPLIPSYT